MRHFRSTLLLVLALSLCAGAGETPVAPSQSDTLTLPLDGNGSISLTRLLDFASENLGFPIHYEACSQEATTFHFTSPVTIPRAEFQGYFERLLLGKWHLYLENGEGKNMIRWVVSANAKSSFWPGASAKFIPFEKLESYSSRGVFVSTCVMLEHLSARDVLSSVSNLMQSSGRVSEMIRPVENVNAVILAAPACRAWELTKLIKSMDVEPTAKFVPTNRTIKTLTARISALEEKLKVLEEKK